jgi:hypothetical protein
MREKFYKKTMGSDILVILFSMTSETVIIVRCYIPGIVFCVYCNYNISGQIHNAKFPDIVVDHDFITKCRDCF